MAAVLPWHLQNLVVIWKQEMEIQKTSLILNLNLWVKIINKMGPRLGGNKHSIHNMEDGLKNSEINY